MTTQMIVPDTLREVAALPVKAEQRLTGEMKRVFSKQITEQFENKRSLYQTVKEQRQRAVLESYKRSVNFETLRRRLDASKAQVARIETEIEALGLQSSGERITYLGSNATTAQKRAHEKLDRLFEAIEVNAPDHEVERKLITRLWLCETVGEGTVILRAVMGNGILPSAQR